MKPCNNNLLIPIHPFLNTQKAVAEAMKRAKPWQTSIHLVCLMRSWNPLIMMHPASAFERTLNDDLDAYLNTLLNIMHWKALIEKGCPGVTVRVHLRKGFSWRSLVLHTTQKVGPGTIILASGPKRHWFSFRNFISMRILATQTGCQVCSIKTDAGTGLTKKAEILATPSTNKISGSTYNGLSAFYSRYSFHPLSHN